MAYTNNIPTASQFISVSQPLIKANFQELDTYTQVDHVALNATNQGTHNKVSFNQQTVDPGVAGTFTELYTKLVPAVTGKPRLFIQNIDGIYQLSGVNPVSAASGYTWLPGGILMQWRTTTCASGSVITFPVAFSGVPYSIQCTIKAAGNRHFVYAAASSATDFTTTQLDSSGHTETNTFSWLAIGPA